MTLPAAVKAAAMALCLLPVSFEAQAISRYTSTSMACVNIQATIRAEGAAIFRWMQPPDIQRYDRFVAGSGYCFFGERAQITFIPSADTQSCAVYECRRYECDDDLFCRPWLR